MRKILLGSIAILLCFGIKTTQAQDRIPLFSPALFMGSDYSTSAPSIRGRTTKTSRTRNPVVRSRTLLRYDNDNAGDLTDKHKKQLYAIAEHYRAQPFNYLYLTVFAPTHGMSSYRTKQIHDFLVAYIPNLHMEFNVIVGNNMLDSAKNTIDIAEM